MPEARRARPFRFSLQGGQLFELYDAEQMQRSEVDGDAKRDQRGKDRQSCGRCRTISANDMVGVADHCGQRDRGEADARQATPGVGIDPQPAAPKQQGSEQPGPNPAGQGNRRSDTDVTKPWKQQQAADNGHGETSKGGKHGGMRVLVRE